MYAVTKSDIFQAQLAPTEIFVPRLAQLVPTQVFKKLPFK
jgi:hypothetical protein